MFSLTYDVMFQILVRVSCSMGFVLSVNSNDVIFLVDLGVRLEILFVGVLRRRSLSAPTFFWLVDFEPKSCAGRCSCGTQGPFCIFLVLSLDAMPPHTNKEDQRIWCSRKVYFFLSFIHTFCGPELPTTFSLWGCLSLLSRRKLSLAQNSPLIPTWRQHTSLGL